MLDRDGCPEADLRRCTARLVGRISSFLELELELELVLEWCEFLSFEFEVDFGSGGACGALAGDLDIFLRL